MKRPRPLTELLLLLLALGALLLTNVGKGSFHNSDDVLYAQITREAAQGHLWPMTYQGRTFDAKPPLAFWLGATTVKLFGDRDATFRFLAVISFLALAVLTYLSFRPISFLSAALALLILLGSPLLADSSRRVLLDLPLAALALGTLLAARTAEQKSYGYLAAFGLASLGFWTKGAAVLPTVGAILVYWLLFSRSCLRERSFWAGLGIFCIAVLAWTLHVSGTNAARAYGTIRPVALHSADSFRFATLYLQTLFADTPFLLAFPLALPLALRTGVHRSHRSLFWLFLLSTLLQTIAATMVRAPLPHYLLGAILSGLLFVALAASNLRPVWRASLVVLALTQALSANLFRFDPSDPDMDPAPATRELAQQAASFLSPDATLCAVDTYFVGFHYYSQRPAIGLYTTDRAFGLIRPVREFHDLVFRVEISHVQGEVQKRCGGYAVLPEGLLDAFDSRSLEVLGRRAPLALVRFNSGRS